MSVITNGRKRLCFITALIMMVSLLAPMTSVYGAEAGNSKKLAQVLDTETFGNIGTEGSKNYVTAMTKDASGNLIVSGVAKSKMGDSDAGTDERVFIKKYAASDLDTPTGTAVIIGSGKEQVKDKNGYVFATKTAGYYSGGSMENGAMAADSAGNIYIAVTEKSSSTLVDWEDVAESNADCICNEAGFCDNDGCIDDNWDEVDNCPACNAFREFKKDFKAGNKAGITLFKFDKNLNQVKKMTVADYASTGTGTLKDPEARSLAVDSSGNIYIGGGTPSDMGFDSPKYGFNAFDTDLSGSGKKVEDKRGFIAKVASDMESVTASTYLGGTVIVSNSYSGFHNYVTGMEVADGQLYVTGWDCGGKINTTSGAFQETKEASSDRTDQEAYIAKLSLSDLSIQGATYFGGSSYEQPMALKLSGDCVYIAGKTKSKDLPVSTDAYQKDLKLHSVNIYDDAFIMKMDKSLKKTDDFAATYYGGEQREDLFALDIDSTGKAYITGECYSAYTLPTTDGSGGSDGGGCIYLSKFDENFTTLLSGTCMGYSCNGNQGRGLVVKDDQLYLAGQYRTASGEPLQPFIGQYETSLAHSAVTKITAGFNSGAQYYGAGQTVQIKVSFSTQVKVSGTPVIELNATNGGEKQKAEYKSGSGTRTLVFEWTTKEGDTTNGELLNCSSADALKLEDGATILCTSGGKASDVSLKVPTDKYSLPYANIYVKTQPMKVTGVTSSEEDGTYGPGAEIPITVTFDDAVKSVTGTPELALNSGGKAVFKGQNKTNKNKLEFLYTVGKGDHTEKLDYADTAALTLPNGAKIVDNYNTDAALTLAEPGKDGSISKAKNIAIDKEIAVVEKVSVADTYHNKPYGVGKEIPITVTFSKPVTTTGKMELNLNANTASYGGVKAVAEPVTTASKEVNFLYKVGKDDNTSEYLDYTSNTALKLVDGAEINVDGGSASLYLPSVGGANSLTPAKIVIDTTVPTVNANAPTQESTGGKGKYLKAGSVITLKVTASELLTIKEGAKPYVEMNYKTDENAEDYNRFEYAKKADNAGKTTLYFDYTVKKEDVLNKGTISFSSGWKIHAKDGDITDIAGNNLNCDLKSPGTITNPFSGLYFDSIAPEWADGAKLEAEAVAGGKSIKITGSKATDSGSGISSSGYTLYRQVKSSSDEPAAIKTSFSSTYTDTATTAGTTYVYSLIAKDNAENTSSALTADATSNTESGETVDNDPPYWDDDKTLKVTRITDDKVKLTWNKDAAHDDKSSIGYFKLYVKEEGASDWTLAKSVSGKDQEAEVEGVNIYKTYQFKVEAQDDGSKTLISTDGPIAKLQADTPEIVIKNQSGKVLKNFISEELSALEEDKEEGYPSSYQKPVYQERFSGLSVKEGQKYHTYYAATGISVEKLLKLSGVENYTKASFYDNGMSGGKTLTKGEISGETKQYYYGPNYDGINVKERQVKPMLAFYYGESETTEPGFLVNGEVPRLLYGQATKDTANRNQFTKNVYYITVNTIEEASIIQSGSGYDIEKDASIPTAVATADGDITVKAQIDGTKYQSDNLDVTYVQMRNNKMINLSTVKHDNKSTFTTEKSLTVKKGDKVLIYVLDNLDGTKGTRSEILNEGKSDATPDISIHKVTDKNLDKAVISGVAEPLTWASVKVTDKDGSILYFNGTMANEVGEFIFNADLSEGKLPLDITVTSGKNVKTETIKSEDQPIGVPVVTAKSNSYNSIKVSWTKVDGSAGYEISRKAGSSGKYKVITTAKATAKSYTNKKLVTGKTYYYKIRAFKTVDGKKQYGAYSKTKSAKPSLSKVTLNVTAGTKKANLKWSKASGVSGYTIYRASSKSGKYQAVKTVKGSTTVKYTNTKLKSGKKYYYKVRAYRVVSGKKVYSPYSQIKAVKVK